MVKTTGTKLSLSRFKSTPQILHCLDFPEVGAIVTLIRGTKATDVRVLSKLGEKRQNRLVTTVIAGKGTRMHPVKSAHKAKTSLQRKICTLYKQCFLLVQRYMFCIRGFQQSKTTTRNYTNILQQNEKNDDWEQL